MIAPASQPACLPAESRFVSGPESLRSLHTPFALDLLWPPLTWLFLQVHAFLTHFQHCQCCGRRRSSLEKEEVEPFSRQQEEEAVVVSLHFDSICAQSFSQGKELGCHPRLVGGGWGLLRSIIEQRFGWPAWAFEENAKTRGKGKGFCYGPTVLQLCFSR